MKARPKSARRITLLGVSGVVRFLLWVICASAGVLLVPSSTAQPRLTVTSITISNVGPVNVSDSLVRANIRVKEGDPYSRPSIDKDIQNLYETGYFHQIRVDETIGLEGGVGLTYYLQAKSILTEIQFSGNQRISTRKLKKKVTSKIGEPLDERTLFTDAQEIRKYYQKKGLPKTEVRYVPRLDIDAGRAVVTFEIQESPKVKIESVFFPGAHDFSQRRLRRVVKTRSRWMFSWLTGSGVLKDEVLDEDKDRLPEFYRSRGYIDFDLKNIAYLSPSTNRVIVQFVITEGQRYRVGAIGFKGVTLFPTNDILKKLKMQVGEIFTPKGLRDDLEIIEDVYGAKGYIDARIVAQRNPNIATGTMDLVYDIVENNKSFIEKVEIRGNTKTKDRVIRRELAVAPGEVFDMVKIKLSRGRLEQLQYFERVETQPEPTEVPDRRNLVVAVEEKNTGNFTIGAGFSSVDSILGFVEVTQGNFDLFKPPWFTGGGQKFRLRVQIGAERQDYIINFVEPWFLGKKLEFSTELYHRELNYVSFDDLYDERRTGARFGLRKALGSDFLIGGVSYTIENVGIFNVDDDASQEIKMEEGDRLVSKIGTSISYDTRNSVVLPDAGQRTEIRTELAGGPFGGDTDFYKLELRSARYLPGFFKGHVVEIGGRVGVVDSYGDADRVPLFDRWFLGGIFDLRGYRFRDVGPKDENGEPIGGSTYWFGTVEYSLPIIERLRFAMFYDVGMVYQDAYSFTPKGFDTGVYNDNWGIGLRINLPIGPLRLDYGIPITSDDENESSGRFQFSVGYTRDF